MKNYIKFSIFTILAAVLIFIPLSGINFLPSKTFAQRSPLDEDYCPPEICEIDFGNDLDEECLPGICGDEEDENFYLDTGDELPDDDLLDEELPDNALPDSALLDDDQLDDEFNEPPSKVQRPPVQRPPVQKLPVQKRPEVTTEPLVKEEPEIEPEEDISDAISELVEDIDEQPEPVKVKKEVQAEEGIKPAQEDIISIKFENIPEEKLVQKIEEIILEQAQQQLQEKQEEEGIIVEELQIVLEENPAFEEIVPEITLEVVEPIIKDVNSNGIPDNVEKDAGIDSSKVDKELIKVKAELAVKKVKLTREGKSKKEIHAMIKKELRKKKTEKKKKVIRQAAEKKFKQKITHSAQDTNRDGVSDEVEMVFGLNPAQKADAKAEFSEAEKKIYNVEPAQVSKKCTMNVRYGDKLSSKGFTVLAACPKNKSFTLYAVDKKGNATALATKSASNNSKLVFAVDKKFKTGKYVFQIKPVKAKQKAFWPFNSLFANVANAQADSEVEKSDPIIVDVVEDTDIEQPVVQKIENVEISQVRDIKIAATSDGRIRVTGVTDLDTMVIGTFESAVFTSALLADVENGMFEVTSSQALEAGQHEVVIYATRLEDKVQSPPVRLSFSIIETAKAAAVEEVRPVAAASEAGFPVMPVAVGGIVLALIGAFVFWRKSKING